MSKLLIYVGEGQSFDLPETIRAITSMPGVSKSCSGQLIGAVFECEYTLSGKSTIVRISEDLETVTTEGLGAESLDFAIRLQSLLKVPLSAIDMDYSFNVNLLDFGSASEFRDAIQKAVRRIP